MSTSFRFLRRRKRLSVKQNICSRCAKHNFMSFKQESINRQLLPSASLVSSTKLCFVLNPFSNGLFQAQKHHLKNSL